MQFRTVTIRHSFAALFAAAFMLLFSAPIASAVDTGFGPPSSSENTAFGRPLEAEIERTNKMPIADDFVYALSSWNIPNGGEFGYKRSNGIYHLGTDVNATAGTPVFSMGNGIVRHIGVHSRFGTVVLVEHQLRNGERLVSLYGHLRTTDDMPKVGSTVLKGQYIGQIGSEGVENGYWEEHLHMGIRPGAYVPVSSQWVYWGLGNTDLLAEWVNPNSYIKKHLAPDVDPDNKAKFITVPATKSAAEAKTYFRNGKKGREKNLKDATLVGYGPQQTSGADIAIGDVVGDKEKEIIIGAGAGAAPEVRIFDRQKKMLLGSFNAYESNFTGGVRVTTGNIDGKGKEEIITGAGPGGGPHVRVFSGVEGDVVHGKIFPFSEKLRTGVDVGTGDTDEDGKDEIIVGTGPGTDARVRILEGDGKLKKNKKGKTLTISPYPKAFIGGARVSSGDIDKDGIDEILIGAGPSGGPHLRVFEPDGTAKDIHFFAFHENFRGGIDVASTDWNNDGQDDVIISQTSNGQAWVKIYNYDKKHTIFSEFNAYKDSFEGGANVAGF